MTPLPHWAEGSAAVLAVGGPHAIPISTALRAADDRILFALGARRRTLELLRDDPRAALCLMAEGAAFTAHGRATVIREPLEAVPLAALELRVETVQDHLADGRTEMLAAPGWRWTSEKAAGGDRAVREELRRLAAG